MLIKHNCKIIIYLSMVMKKFFSAIAFTLGLNVLAIAQPSIGSIAPDIALPNAKGVVTSLSSLKGKVVLIDFWASWCGPCRINNRAIIPVYKKYSSKGFEILSVSIDANPASWLKAIEQDKMDWKQVIDTQAAYGNELSKTWDLQYIPSTFLINKEGKVVAQGVEKKELEKLLIKML